MPRQPLLEAQAGPFTDNGAIVSNNAKANANFVELFQMTFVVDVTGGATTRQRIAPPAGRTIASIELRRQAAVTGTVSAAVKDGDGNTLLSTATVDATGLTAAFVAQTLTGTTANLAIVAGEPIALEVVAAGGAAGGPVVARVTFATA